MNGRYKELANQARDQCILEFSAHSGRSTAWAWEEKFAELIVRDCLKHVSYMPSSGDSDDLALETASTSIKEHFGIE